MAKRRGNKGGVRPTLPAPEPAAPEAVKKTSDDVALQGSVISELPLWQQFGRIGGSMTPAQVTNIIGERDMGKINRFVDLLHECRQKDSHLHSCLAALESDISGCEWSAQPALGTRAPRKSETKLAEVFEAAVSECQGFIEMLAHLVGEGEQFGHATSEVIWGYYEGANPILRGWFVPLRVKNINCNRFGFHTQTGALLFDAQNNANVDTGGVDLLAKYPAGKIIQHRPRINGDVPVREGVGSDLVWDAIFRNWDIRDWMITAEQGWKPTKVATWKKMSGHADKEDQILANRLAQSFIASGGIAKPDTIDFDIQWPKNNLGQQGSQHKELVEWLGQEISKALLGHTQVVEVGTKGARSASEVGYKVAEGRKRPRALALAMTLHRQLTIPFVQMNKPGKQPPYYLPNLEAAIDALDFGRALEKFTKAGLKTPSSWARGKLKMPPPASGEECMDPRDTGGATAGGGVDGSEEEPEGGQGDGGDSED